MSVHTNITQSVHVCGALHKKTGSTCLRPADHAGQHVLSHEDGFALWTKDHLSCTCKTADMCSSQKCVFAWPIGASVAQNAVQSSDWVWEGAL